MRLSRTISLGPPAILWTWLAGLLSLPALYFGAFFTGWIEHAVFRPLLPIAFILSPCICLVAILVVKGPPLWFRLVAIIVTAVMMALLLVTTFFVLGCISISQTGLEGTQ